MSSANNDVRPNDIAVIGMAVRVPGARSLDEFWANLRAGREAITFFTDDELREAGVDPARLADPHYVKANAVLADADRFDAGFFGYTPREAELLDVQHRVFLECAWTTFEHAGYDPLAVPGAVGVFAGAGLNTYLLRQIARNPAAVASAGGFQILIANDKDFLATRVSYKLNLRGPSVAVQSACSTSLVAVHLAVQSLLAGDCDAALAGGVSIRVPQTEGYTWQEGMILSRDGHCRPFDAKAAGTIGGNGAGVVLLKRAEEALAAGDTIHAIIRGSALNNDGAGKMGYTAPSIEGQEAVINEALAVAGVTPDEIGYVEAHGTGTPLGDPIEVTALTRAFRSGTSRRQLCALGSVKSNVGHLDAAAGVVGLIKAVLAVREGEIPPSLHFETPNPQIDFAAGPFRVASALTPWRESAGRRRRAGVSSFGIGGTNAHVVLEQAPDQPKSAAPAAKAELLVVSARTAADLARLRETVARDLEQNAGPLAPTAYTLAAGRHAFSHRSWTVAARGAEAARRLREAPTQVSGEPAPAIAFLFPGQGTQYPGMAAGLYASEPVFRTEVDRCAELLRPHIAFDLRRLLLDASTSPQMLARTDLAQPALFVTSYALAQLWMAWGIKPHALLGHSIGEWVAACLAGVFTLEDALRLVAARGRLMAAQPPGAMLAVGLDEVEARALLGDGIDLAAVNATGQTVVSGPEPAIAALVAKLDSRGVAATRLQTSHAYHSAMMEPAARALRAEFAGVALGEPQLRWVSNVTGTWITAAEAKSPEYWARHLRGTVRFRDGLQTLLEAAPEQLLIEMGAGRTLTGFVERHAARKPSQVAIASGRGARDQTPDEVVLREALGRAWAAGAVVDWNKVFMTDRRRVPLPTYPFAGERYWIDAQPTAAALPAQAAVAKRPDVADWFYVPAWQPGALPRELPAVTDGEWAIVPDAAGLAQVMAARLRALGARVRVTASPKDLLAAPVPRWIVSLRDVDGATEPEAGFDALCALGADLAGATLPSGARLVVAASGVCAFPGERTLNSGRALLLGPARVLPNEVPGLQVKVVDVIAAGGTRETLAEQLIAEVRGGGETLVAWRGSERWIGTTVPTRLDAPLTPPWRERGVYVITGGCGGIGLTIAESLAKRCRARLVLIGRSRPDATILTRIAALSALGAEVYAAEADVTDEAQMRRVHAEVKERFGAIHGVIHAAGAPGGGALARRASPEESAAVLGPKVKGTQIIDRVFGNEPLDFLVLMSSLTAELGEFGQARYAAANAYLDAFAAERRSAGRPVTAIAWDAWRDVGMAARSPGEAQLAQWHEQQKARRITADEGIAVLDRAVASGHARLIVSTVDLAVRRQELVAARKLGAPTEPGAMASPPADGAARALHPRPALAGSYEPPVSMKQRRIAAVWEDLLGISSVGINDSFFDLGGHSLLATQAVARLRETGETGLTLAAFFATPTIAGLAATTAGPAADEPALAPVPRTGDLPLSFAQEALWLVDRMDGGSAHYNEFGAQRIRGPLDAACLERALNTLVERHEVLRTRFEMADDLAVQRIDPARPVSLTCVDATAADLAAHAAALAAAPFSLARGPLLRAELLRLGAEDHVLMVAVHHIVFDGWSSAVFFREAIVAYAAIVAGRTPELPKLPVQYADFAVWQRRLLAGARRNASVTFWKEQLGGPLPVLRLPSDRPRPARQSHRGRRLPLEIDGMLQAQLGNRAREQGATLFMLLLAGYAALLGREAGQEEIVVGCPLAGREMRELEPLIGLFINPLPIRISLAGEPTLAQLVERVRSVVVAAYAHAALPFEQIVEAVRPPRDPSRAPLAQALLTFQNAMPPAPMTTGLTIEPWQPDDMPSRSDLDWYGWETAGGVGGYFVYNCDLFDAVTAERWRARLLRLLGAIATEPQLRLSEMRFETTALPALRRARPAGTGSTPS